MDVLAAAIHPSPRRMCTRPPLAPITADNGTIACLNAACVASHNITLCPVAVRALCLPRPAPARSTKCLPRTSEWCSRSEVVPIFSRSETSCLVLRYVCSAP